MAANRSCFFARSFVALLFTLVVFTGCQRNPYDEKISARHDRGFELWLSGESGSFSPAEIKDLNEARQQIKLAAMTETPGLSSAELDVAVYAQINGHTVRDVLLRGLEIQIDRLAKEIARLEERENRYRQVDPARLEADAREFLTGFTERLAQRRENLQKLNERALLVRTR